MSISAPSPSRPGDGPGDPPKPEIVKRLQAQRARQKSRSKAFRAGTVIGGFAVVALGILALPFPGPGWLIIFVGLAVLSLEFEWAGRALDWLLIQVAAFQRWLKAAPVGVKVALGLAVALVLAAIAAWAYFGDIPLLPV